MSKYENGSKHEEKNTNIPSAQNFKRFLSAPEYEEEFVKLYSSLNLPFSAAKIYSPEILRLVQNMPNIQNPSKINEINIKVTNQIQNNIILK